MRCSAFGAFGAVYATRTRHHKQLCVFSVCSIVEVPENIWCICIINKFSS